MDQVDNVQETTETVSTDAQTEVAPNPDRIEALDLDKYDKPFKFQGKEWNVKDFQEHHVPKSVFTKKSQEIAQERKYAENVGYDLDKLMDNPELLQDFKRLYPERYHAQAERIVDRILRSQGQDPNKAPGQPIDRGLEKRLTQMERYFQQQEAQAQQSRLQSNITQLESIAKENMAKYKFASEDLALAKAQALLDKAESEGNTDFKLDKDVWDKIYKSIHDTNQKQYEQHYKELVTTQKNANRQAKDMGAGGGTPGQAPNEPRTIKEATKLAIRDLTGA